MVMIKRSALRRLFALAALWTAALVFGLPIYATQAGDRNGPSTQDDARSAPNHSGPAFGGYSMTLRDVWGPAQMPPTPQDFGPHFDFQPEPLHGGLSHDPYPN
jgi:hypothetical protein